MEYRLGELARILGAELRGDPARRVGGVATLSRAGRGDLSFLHNHRYRGVLAGTRASAVVLEAKFAEESPTACLVMDNPYLGYARAAALSEAAARPVAAFTPARASARGRASRPARRSVRIA